MTTVDGAVVKRWDDAPPQQAHELLVEQAARLESHYAARRYDHLAYLRYVSGRDLPDVYAMAMARRTRRVNLSDFRAPTFNTIAANHETLMASVGRNRPWIKYVTDGGRYTSRYRGRMMTKFTDGLFYEHGVYHLGQLAIGDGLTFGTGFVKVFDEGGEACVEHPLTDEVWVDDREAVYGKPKRMYQRRFCHVDDVVALYGNGDAKRVEAIQKSRGVEPGVISLKSIGYDDMLSLVEGWSLPTRSGRKGRHVIAVRGLTLIDEPWNEDDFPFVPIRFRDTGVGYWGQGLAEILYPIQVRIDRLDGVIEEAQARVGRPWIFAKQNSIKKHKMLAAGVANYVEYTSDNPPVVAAFPSVSQDLYNDLETWIQRSFNRAGNSAMRAMGVKPSGLNSGEAQRVHAEITDTRQIIFGQAVESFYVEIAKKMIAVAKKVKPKVLVPGRGEVEIVDWSKIETDVTKGDYVPYAFPLSSLGITPQARLERADEMRRTGEIEKEDYMRLREMPDTTSQIDLRTAPRDLVEQILDAIVEEGRYEWPEEGMDLEACKTIGLLRWNLEKKNGTPRDRLRLILRFVRDASAKIKRLKAAEAAPPAAAPAPGTPEQAAATPAQAGPLGGVAQTVNPQVPSDMPPVPASVVA